MNLRSLKYLLAVADHRHFGKAANICFVSQPTLSMQLKKLEDELGVKLFERNNKNVFVTDIGQEIVDRVRYVIKDLDQIVKLAKASRDPFSGELKIGVIPTLAPYLLPKIIPNLAKAYPQLSLYLIEEQTEKIVTKLKQGELDLLILALPIDHDAFHAEPLFNENFLLAVPPNHVLAKLKTVKPSHLVDQDLMLLEEGHCLRDQALEICDSVGAQEAGHFQATSLETIRQMVAAGVGITLIPELACHKNNKNICYIPFKNPQPTRSIGMVWRKTTAREVLLNDIVKKVKARFDK